MRASFSGAATLLLMAVGIAANAQFPTLNVSYTNDANEAVTVNGSAVKGGTDNTQAIPLMAVLNTSLTSSSAPFTVYCIDLQDTQSPANNQAVTITSITSSTGNLGLIPAVSGQELSEASYLISNYGAAANGASMSNGTPSSYETLQAALQLAIWGVVSGDTLGPGLDIGTHTAGLDDEFYLSNVTDAQSVIDANKELAALYTAVNGGGGLGNGTLYQVNPDQSNGIGGHVAPGQNLLGAAPEGSTIALFAFGLAPLFGFKWLAARRRTVN
jgi:hypothetical protein